MSTDRDDSVDTGGARDSETAVPTGKAGRGDTAVAKRVRTDADTPEDTRTGRTNPITFIRQVAEELRKVIWPTRQTTLRLTGIVLSVTLATSVFLGAVDFLFSKLISLILSI